MSDTERTSGTHAIIDLIGGRLEVVARIDSGGAGTVLLRGGVAPGRGVPLHSHADPECFYVLSGQLDVFLDGDAPGWRTVQAGGSIVAADGVRHALRNSGGEVADLLVMTNDRLFGFFSEAGRAAEAGTPVAAPTAEDFARIARVAAEYGYWLASPEEHAAITA